MADEKIPRQEPGSELLGSFRRDADGLGSALELLGIKARFNERAHRIEWFEESSPIRQRAEPEWAPTSDRIEDWIRNQIQKHFITGKKNAPLWFGRETWAASLNSHVRTRSCDPFADWLLSLRGKWEGKPMLDNWIGEVFDSDTDTDLLSWASRAPFLGAVWRTFRPGTKIDEFLILIGSQGCGKSTACSQMLPPDMRREGFSDSLNLGHDEKARVESIQSRIIVEVQELAGLRRGELESVKAFLSRQEDSVRLAYRRNPETMPRRCVFIGTGNKVGGGSLVSDSSGHRRFVPVEVREGRWKQNRGAKGIRWFFDVWREQLWAEAVERYVRRKDHEPWLPADLADAQREATEDHRVVDIFEERLEKWMAEDRPPAELTMEEIANGLRINSADLPRIQGRVADALRQVGWDRKISRRSGSRKRVWFRPGAPPEDAGDPGW